MATKIGRRAPLDVREYTPEAFRGWIDRSRDNLGMDTLDLVQLHCLPTQAYYMPELFAALDELVAEGALAHYGVSVEKVEEGLKALEYPNVATVQIVFNAFRQRPAERFLAEALRRDVGVHRARAAGERAAHRQAAPATRRSRPRTTGCTTGTARASTWARRSRASTTRRASRRSRSSRPLVPDGATLAQLALRWILMHPGITTTIPGAKTPEQARANAAAADLPALDDPTMETIGAVYDEHIRPLVHQRW